MADGAPSRSPSRPAFDVDAVVIGAGAVGLACAATIARSGLHVLVLESAGVIGSGTSSRNSEVVHAGIYYPTGSLKHRLCVAGRRLLYPYMAARGVRHWKAEKLIVATNDRETAKIAQLLDVARANEVEGVRLMDGADARRLEPNLACTAALMSAETGVMDSHGLMLAYQGELEDLGGAVVFETPLERAEILAGGGFALWTGGREPARITTRVLVNSAGLHAQAVAARLDGYDPALIPAQTLAKGSYFGCAGKPAFKRLIYPAPVDGGLGVHLTLDLAGRMRFGPDVEWLTETDPDRVDYAVDIRRAESFYAAIRTYWPALPDGALTPDYAGLRPKLSGPGQPAADFRIDGPSTHGHEGLVHLFGIESPGLTSSLAIAAETAAHAGLRATLGA
ncbi:MAG: NAD(P)/FAD-dependent oxidoreductase [Hyphomonadaceae bacterium]|nr:NAD(P)/FAD-dependent oxidoreductase [Hyphomonadaceae bacterium]